MLYTGGVLLMADKLYEKTIHSAATLSTSHRHKYLAREAWWLNRCSTRQTVVLQSWVRIRPLPSPYLTAISWWVATWDGTWLRADLCEGQQRRILRKNEPLVRQKHKKEKKYPTNPATCTIRLSAQSGAEKALA
jgi:hypothetical protein